MGTLSITLFGSFQASIDAQPIGTFRTNKAQALLVYLAIEHDHAHRREALYTLLWPDMPLMSAQTNLRQVLYRLRQMFPDLSDGKNEAVPLLLSDRQTVRLNPNAALEVDLHRFDALLAGVRNHKHSGLASCAACLESLETAATLYRGDFLDDFYLDDSNEFEDWAQAVRETYRGKVLDALENLTRAYLEGGAYDQAAQTARRQLVIDPLRERAHRGLMEALARNGARRAAISHYEAFQGQLMDELGLDPAPETQILVKAIHANTLEPLKLSPQPTGEPTTTAEPPGPLPKPQATQIHQTSPAVGLQPFRHNLPVQPTPFIGRETELTSLDRLLADPDIRLVTIVGPGGMGKTRLALAWAERQLTNLDGPMGDRPDRPYMDGIFFVDLAPLNEPVQIVPAIIEALQIQISGGEAGTPEKRLLAYLADKQMLFILDNFEHLLAGAGLAAEMLSAAPGVQIITTSRERLHLRGEQLFQIPGLEFPDWVAPEDAAEYTAALLFLNAARHIRADFELTDDDLPHLTRICQLVGGMPLALELAAGWVELLSLGEIAAEIGRGLGFLETDLQDIPDRQRSMRAIFESTWERLEPGEQDFMQKLSVFRGGFTREAVGQVTAPVGGAAATLRLLARLVNKSLLQTDPTRGRYQIHELLRQYALMRLEVSGTLETTRTAHADYFLDLLHQREGEIKGGRKQKEALDTIEADFANIQVAWIWSLDQGNLEAVGYSLEAFFWFCYLRSRRLEAAQMLLQAEAQFAPSSGRLSNALWRRIAIWRANMDRNTWTANYYHKRLNESKEILAVAREDGSQEEVAFALAVVGILHWAGDPSTAITYLQESQALYHRLGDTFLECWALGCISWTYLNAGHPEKRVEVIRQQLEMAQKHGDQLTAADAQGVLGFVAERAGRYTEAEVNYQEVLLVFREYRDRYHTCEYLVRLGELAFLAGDFSQARRWVAEAQLLTRHFNVQWNYALSTLSMIHNSEEGYAQTLIISPEGYYVSNPRDTFPTLRGIAYAQCGLDDFTAAREPLRTALEMAVSIKAPGWQVQMLPAAALIAASEDQLARAAELLALAYHHPAAATGWQDQFPLITRLRARLAAELAPETLKAAQERGAALDLAETIKTTLEALT